MNSGTIPAMQGEGARKKVCKQCRKQRAEIKAIAAISIQFVTIGVLKKKGTLKMNCKNFRLIMLRIASYYVVSQKVEKLSSTQGHAASLYQRRMLHGILTPLLKPGSDIQTLFVLRFVSYGYLNVRDKVYNR